MTTEPDFCTLQDPDEPGWVAAHGGRHHCALLAGHAGDCTYHLQVITDGVDRDAIEAAWVVTEEWRTWNRWREIAPRRHRDAEVATLAQPTSDVIETWVAAELESRKSDALIGNVILLGEVGCGKTWAACALARAVITTLPRDRKIQVTSVVDMFRRLRPEGGSTSEEFIVPRLLVLDDLGVEKVSEWTEERLFEIIDARWRNNDPTVVTTNLTPAQVKEAVGARIYDRLRDGALAVHLPGSSRRSASLAGAR